MDEDAVLATVELVKQIGSTFVESFIKCCTTGSMPFTILIIYGILYEVY